MNSKIKNFDNQGYNEEVVKLLKDGVKAKAKKNSLIAFSGINTLEEIETYLNDKTGFVNTNLSATALGLEEQYSTILNTQDVEITNYTTDFKSLSSDFTVKLKEKYTTYWSDEELSEIKEIAKAIKVLNKLSLPSKLSIYRDRNNQYNFNQSVFIYQNQILNRR